MKKPSKNPILKKARCHLFDIEVVYSPDDLRDIAYSMETQNLEGIMLEASYETSDFVEFRRETPREASVRYGKELKKWNKWKEDQKKAKQKKKDRLIREAKKLGLKISK